MYGQTEATGRMSVLPPQHFSAKRGSVGAPVEGGAIHCDSDGAIVFRGPNVMLGYAECREDLTDLDELRGSLETGDRGYLDGDGFLYITGRNSRIAKLLGSRINLDEIEGFLNGPASTAVICDDHILHIHVEGGRSPEFDRKVDELMQRLRLPGHFVVVRAVHQLPRNDAGKIRYAAFQSDRRG
jgi:acyl-CoA synthetase (AMP-forming)/AMP-acid ligase II